MSDQRNRELERQLASGDLDAIGPMLGIRLRTGRIVEYFVALLDAIPFLELEEDHLRELRFEEDEDYEEEYRRDPDLVNLRRLPYLDFLLPPAARVVAGIYLKRSLGYLFNLRPDWYKELPQYVKPVASSSRRTRGNFRQISERSAENYLSRYSQGAIDVKKRSVTPKQVETFKEHLRWIVSGLVNWKPHHELLFSEAINLGEVPQEIEPLVKGIYDLGGHHGIFGPVRKRDLVFICVNAFDNSSETEDPQIEALAEICRSLLSIARNGSGIEEVIKNCQTLARESGASAAQLHRECLSELSQLVFATSNTERFEYKIQISTAPEVGGIGEEINRVRPIIEKYLVINRDDEVEDDGYFGGDGYAFFCSLSATIDEWATMRAQLAQEINTNRLEYMENTPWAILTSLTDW